MFVGIKNFVIKQKITSKTLATFIIQQDKNKEKQVLQEHFIK